MNALHYKDWLFTIIGTGILITLVIIIVQLSSIKKTDGATLGQQVQQQTQTQDSMHGPAQPADAKIFSSLVGKTAPDFTLESYSREKITLSALRGKNVILFFNEGLMCYPACWNQVAAFGKDTVLKAKNTVVLNITVDPKKDWQEAVGKMPELATATVLLDTDKKVSVAYGVLSLASSMHKGQFPGHSYVIIDSKGTVRFAQDDANMAIRNKELTVEIDKL